MARGTSVRRSKTNFKVIVNDGIKGSTKPFVLGRDNSEVFLHGLLQQRHHNHGFVCKDQIQPEFSILIYVDFCNLLKKSFSGKVLQPTYPWRLQNAAKEYNSNLWFFLSHFPHLAVLHKDSQMGQDVVWNLGEGDLPTLI